MTVDRVNFNEEEVRKMSEEDFIARHAGLFWLDRDEQTRRKMLADVYSRIARPKAKARKDNN